MPKPGAEMNDGRTGDALLNGTGDRADRGTSTTARISTAPASWFTRALHAPKACRRTLAVRSDSRSLPGDAEMVLLR
jgi:hypothetical protein